MLIEKDVVLGEQLDGINDLLFQKVCCLYNLKVFNTKIDSCYCICIQGDDCVIGISSVRPKPAFFTHELLHAVFKKIVFNWNGLFFANIDQRIKVHVTNTLEHRYTYPIYLKMGYAPIDFLSEGDSPLISLEKAKSQNGIVDIILNCFTVLGNVLPFHSYDDIKDYLNFAYPVLYTNVGAIISSWDNFNFECFSTVRFNKMIISPICELFRLEDV